MSNMNDTTSCVYLEDGPLFRATIKEYEDRTSFMKSDLKDMIAAATCSFKARQNLMESEQEFIRSAQKASFTQPLFDLYLNQVLDKLREQQERLHFCMQTLVIDPLKKLYELDIKVADTKKRQFEETSKDYYVQLSKYLGNKHTFERKRASGQLEFNRKKQQFDLARFDYYTFLTDLHGGKKEQEILYHLLHHHEKQYAFYHEACKTLEQHKKGLEDVAAYIAEASREQTAMNKERNEKRRQIECNYAITIVQPDIQKDKYSGIRDLQQADQSLLSHLGQKKEGFLFTTSKTSKRRNSHGFPGDQWHKYWCVVSKGQLQEYTNWKHHLQTHNKPIVLKLATVKEACEAGRRFCFEVITPSACRVYQATSKEEMTSWMVTINNAICSSLNGTGSSAVLSENTDVSDEGSFSKALDGIARLKPRRSRRRTYEKHSQIYERSQRPKGTYHGPWLLKQLYEQDLANTFCVDCSSPYPDWYSLNLGTLLCIDCSGVHRSLGTHISKVRSFTLDSESLTPELVLILKWIGNQRFNAVWESELSLEKPDPTAPREVKASFIREKYIQKRFLTAPPKNPLIEIFVQGILEANLVQILYTLAWGINVHETIPDGIKLPNSDLPRYPLALALLKREEQAFPVAELLIQNGCEIQVNDWSWIISDEVMDYLNTKIESRGLAPIKRLSLSQSKST